MLELPAWPYLFTLAKELLLLKCYSELKHGDLFDTVITSAVVLEELKFLS